MRKLEKQTIVEHLMEFCEQKGSQAKAAATLKVSAAIVSQMVNGNWEMIRDEMWRTVSAGIGMQGGNWTTVETAGYRRMTAVLDDAQQNSLVMAVVGDAGCGKTQAIGQYVKTHRNAYHLQCAEYWNKKNFLQNLCQQMGMRDTYGTVYELIEDIVRELEKQDSPLIIVDEADKLSDGVLYFFITFYNRLEDHCGIVLTATGYLKKRIIAGERNERKGFAEIHSRVGRNFIAMPQTSADDVAAICEANGVTDLHTINEISKRCDFDLRRVKRLVHAALASKR